MWTALRATFIALLSSRKAVVAMFGAITVGLMRIGFDVDEQTVALVLGPLIAAIVGQGIADHGAGRK